MAVPTSSATSEFISQLTGARVERVSSFEEDDCIVEVVLTLDSDDPVIIRAPDTFRGAEGDLDGAEWIEISDVVRGRGEAVAAPGIWQDLVGAGLGFAQALVGSFGTVEGLYLPYAGPNGRGALVVQIDGYTLVVEKLQCVGTSRRDGDVLEA